MEVCNDCPLRLFNDKHYNLQGVGNPYYGRVIIVPNVDYNAYLKGSMDFSSQVEIVREILHSSTGECDDVYIAPMIRCNEQISCELTDDIYSNCLKLFALDVKKYNYRNIMLLGTAAKRFMNVNIKDYLDIVCISKNNRYYNVNYSPLVKYTNEELFETFKHYLIKWINCVRAKELTYKNYIML